MSDLTDLESEHTNMQCTQSLPKGHQNVDLDHSQSDSNYNWETSLPRLHIFKDYGLYKRITFDPKKKSSPCPLIFNILKLVTTLATNSNTKEEKNPD